MRNANEHKVNMLNEHSPLVRRVKKLTLDYYSNLASFAMMRGDMSDAEVDDANDKAVAIMSDVIDKTNAIENVNKRIAVSAITVFNLATSLYLTLDQALAAAQIDEEFGGGDE